MTFLRPASLAWVFLAVPLVALYLRRDRIARHVVGAGPLWQEVLSRRPLRTRWLRWRRAASLALQLAVLIAIVLAMAEPVFRTADLEAASCRTHLAVVAGVLLVAEWRLFQRRWTC
jgi:hypothetical protein